jgi:hypothetical protein
MSCFCVDGYLQRQDIEVRMVERQAADRKAPGGKNAGHDLRQPGQRHRIHVLVAGADIGMGKRCTAADKLARSLLDFAEHEIALFGHRWAVGVCRPVESDDAAIGEKFAQVIEGTAVAEAELKHRTVERFDLVGNAVEDIALRGQATDETIQAAHRICLVLEA